MRTPPPVLPENQHESPEYQSSWFERTGPDAALRFKAGGYGVLVAGAVFATLLITSLIGGVPSFGVVVGFVLFRECPSATPSIRAAGSWTCTMVRSPSPAAR